MLEDKKSIYSKIFITNTVVIVAIVGILGSFFYSRIVNEVKESKLYINQKITEDTANYIRSIETSNRYVNRNLYNADNELIDMIHFLQMSDEDYLEYRLDEYSDSNKTSYYGVDYFMGQIYEVSDNIVDVGLYSYANKKYTRFHRNGRHSHYYFNGDTNREHRVEKLALRERELRLTQHIKDPVGLKTLGEISVTYTLDPVDQYLIEHPEHRISILDSNHKVIYDSTKQNEGQYYPYIGDRLIKQKEVEDSTDSYIHVEYVQDGYTIIGAIDKSDAVHVAMGVKITIIVLSLLLIMIGGLSVYYKLNSLDQRMRRILGAMNEVVQGNFDVIIEEDTYDDELAIITNRFNKMCHELSRYIQKSYLAEIQQKNAEMKALQSQINPHFLYNTLESIRMKAICNGDREVGKMLQNLAIIFRSQIKESTIISIAKELHYCKKYMELFNFRYENKFNFDIICDEGYLNKSIIKFTLQPIIENYFVHGIRLEDTDNYIRIEVTGDGKYLQITVEDNGHGMSKEKIELMNEAIKKCEYNGESMGVINVHERIVMSYGRAYGLEVLTNRPQGVKVVVTIPDEEDKQGV